jgi:solute carrier family 25 (mitochondrial thiamine pyrophosphate transporter), member 19
MVLHNIREARQNRERERIDTFIVVIRVGWNITFSNGDVYIRKMTFLCWYRQIQLVPWDQGLWSVDSRGGDVFALRLNCELTMTGSQASARARGIGGWTRLLQYLFQDALVGEIWGQVWVLAVEWSLIQAGDGCAATEASLRTAKYLEIGIGWAIHKYTYLCKYLELCPCARPHLKPPNNNVDVQTMTAVDPGAQRRATSPIVTAVAGGIAGLTSRFVIAPLDVVKIRLQLQATSGKTYRGPIHAARTIVAQEGVTALWKGNIPAELLYVGYSMVQFVAYRQAHVLLEKAEIPTFYRSFLAGAAAGTCATMATYPLDLLRTRFAAQGTSKVPFSSSNVVHCQVYPSLRQSIPDILRDEGISGYYRGITTSLLQIAPYMGILFGSYETTRTALSTKFPLSQRTSDFLAGGIAGIVSKGVVFPLDTVRKRLQVQGPTRGRYIHSDIPLYSRGILAATKDIIVREGTRGLYKGLGVALLKSGPSAAVTLWVFDGCLLAWERMNHHPGRGGTWHD